MLNSHKYYRRCYGNLPTGTFLACRLSLAKVPISPSVRVPKLWVYPLRSARSHFIPPVVTPHI